VGHHARDSLRAAGRVQAGDALGGRAATYGTRSARRADT
jgi:hypothetical protein